MIVTGIKKSDRVLVKKEFIEHNEPKSSAWQAINVNGFSTGYIIEKNGQNMHGQQRVRSLNCWLCFCRYYMGKKDHFRTGRKFCSNLVYSRILSYVNGTKKCSNLQFFSAKVLFTQRVNFLKVCGAIVFVTLWSMLCAKAKNRHISKGCSGALLRTYQPSSMQNWWAGAVWNGLSASLRFDTKTRRPQVFLPLNLVTHCEVARSYHPVQVISHSL